MAQDVWNDRPKSDSDRIGTQPRSLHDTVERRWKKAANGGLSGAVAAGVQAYDRRRALPRLIALDARELEAADPVLDRSILARLKRSLRAERRRGRAGHWTYDLDRHLALLQAVAGEEGRADITQPDWRRRIEPPRHGADTRSETKNAAQSAGRRS